MKVHLQAQGEHDNVALGIVRRLVRGREQRWHLFVAKEKRQLRPLDAALVMGMRDVLLIVAISKHVLAIESDTLPKIAKITCKPRQSLNHH